MQQPEGAASVRLDYGAPRSIGARPVAVDLSGRPVSTLRAAVLVLGVD